ncbi:MAG: nucleotide sugar dehydrogenase [Campylobacterota bacterium]
MDIKDTVYIDQNATILEALQKIEATPYKALICVDENRTLIGMLFDGDIRRGLINGMNINDPIKNCIKTDPIFFNENTKQEEVKNVLSSKFKLIPIVNSKKRVVDYYCINEKNHIFNIKNKSITILGMGYVGLTLGLVLADEGFRVKGFDINQELVNNLKAKQQPFYEEGLKKYLDKLCNDRINFTTKIDEVHSDVYIITVGTPLLPANKQPNVDYIRQASESIGAILKKGDVVILRSTVPIGCSRDIVLPTIENISGLKCGDDFYLSFAPERTAEGVALKELKKNPQIIGSFDEISHEITTRIFETITNTVINVGTLESAEMCKLIDNTYRDHIFAYANNLSKLTEKLGLNIHDLIDAVNFGYQRNHIPKPSPGVGGPCLSKDPYILSKSFKDNDLNSDLILSVRAVNEEAPALIKEKLISLLKKANKDVYGSKIVLVGLAFKGHPETSDLRDSTSLWVLKALQDFKNMYAYDKVVDDETINALGIKATSLEGAFDQTDAVIVLNNHKSYKNWNLEHLFGLMNKPSVFIDTWNNFDSFFIKQHFDVLYGGLGND